jgi:hypothetical protein
MVRPVLLGPSPSVPRCCCSEKRTGNTLYQELSFQDSEALGDVDEGADITGADF